MRDRFGDARAIAHEFIKQMQAHDLMDLMFFDDLEVVGDTQWMTFDQRADIESKLNEVTATAPSHRGHGALFSEIKSMTKRAFTSLWTSEPTDAIPLHQAMVLLSNGAGAADPQNDVANAEIFRPYLDQGRFSEDDASLPKTPLPVISIWLPDEAPIAENTEGHNDARLMQALANPEIGGFFDVVQRGSGTAKASPIVGLVRARFNAMWLVHWRASCIGPSAEQSFNLVFENTQPPISPDPTFKNVAIGIDPGQWPLDVDRGRTMKAAQDSPVYPGGEVTIFGDFCWSGDRQRAEGYFVPTARLPVTGLTSPTTPDVAKRALQRLQATSVLGTTLATGDTYVTFSVPNDERVLDPRVDARVARLFVYDRKTHQASAIDPTGMLTLQGARTPLARLLIAGLIGLLVVAVLLVVLLLRVAGWGRKTIGEAAGTGPREYDAALAATAAAGAATIRGSAGQFAVHLGSELRVGRDPTQCPIFLSEPRVSGIHATLRFEGGHLLVRDENSNNGTWLHGARIAPGVWTLVPAGTSLRFGPLEFLVQFEA
jgi:hypothetical protein